MSIFNSIPSFTPPRSRQIQKSTRAQDMELGIAYPIYFKELVPGDNIKMSMNDIIRSLPMVKPTMGALDVCINAFFVDHRQVDPDFEDRLSGGETGEVEYTIPFDEAFVEDSAPDPTLNGYKLAMKCDKYTLADYSGIPLYKPDVDEGRFFGDNLILTPYRMLTYNRCWNYYYRDENVCVKSDGTPLYEHDKIGDGRPCFAKYGNSDGLPYVLKEGSGLKHVYLEKDYLGAVLPKRQKGGPFAFPIGGSLNVGLNTSVGDNETVAGLSAYTPSEYSQQYITDALVTQCYKEDGTPVIPAAWDHNSPLYDVNGVAITKFVDGFYEFDTSKTVIGTNNYAPLKAYADSAITFTYDEFRELRALQLYSERLNLCGSRYEEFLMSMFSVAPHSDVLREPVWLAGFTQPIVISEVTQNAPTENSPLGNYAGKAQSATGGYFFNYFAKDYGTICIIAHIRPRCLYTQGIDRQMIKRTRFDFFNPLFAGLSEQEVLKCEAHTKGVASMDSSSGATEILGFNPRYSEMYFDKSYVCGDLRDNQPYWIWSREFADNAVLNGEFALCKHEEYSDRWVVTDEPPFISIFNFVCDITRPCKAYPIPEK